jgi:hypothetical protein
VLNEGKIMAVFHGGVDWHENYDWMNYDERSPHHLQRAVDPGVDCKARNN